MTKRQQPHLTERQMDDLVSADVNDPSAWGDPIVVGASKGPRRMQRAKHMELASKFYVLSVLHRLGADATLTFTQSDNVDITIVQESGRALTVDVKTLTGPMEWAVADFKARASHYLTFVWYPNAKDPTVQPDVYIVASERLKLFLAEHQGEIVPLGRLDAEVAAREAWQQLAEPTAA